MGGIALTTVLSASISSVRFPVAKFASRDEKGGLSEVTAWAW